MGIIIIIKNIIGFLITITAILWPAAHDSHDCPPRDEWKDSICPKAGLMEMAMFLQMGIGCVIIFWGKK